MDDKAKLAALQGISSSARRARNPNAPDRDRLMIAIGLGKPVTTPDEDAAIGRLGDPSATAPVTGAQPHSEPDADEAGGAPDGDSDDEATRIANDYLGTADISRLGQVSPALTGPLDGDQAEDDEADYQADERMRRQQRSNRY